jgi:hypothetical protein
MDLSRLGRGEPIAVLGGLLLALGLFPPWYETAPDNRDAQLDVARGTLSGWAGHPILHWLRASGTERPRKPPGVL